jgi:hypothetical protein
VSIDWLPPLFLLEDDAGDWEAYLERLHRQFVVDFVESRPVWPGKRVNLKRYPEHEGKSATFWHMISTGEREADRLPDFRRCERIAWPRAMMDAFDGAEWDIAAGRLVWWQEERRNEERYILALADFSYVFVVADRGEYVLPLTAYYVEREHRRRKLQKAFRAFWSAQKS